MDLANKINSKKKKRKENQTSTTRSQSKNRFRFLFCWSFVRFCDIYNCKIELYIKASWKFASK